MGRCRVQKSIWKSRRIRFARVQSNLNFIAVSLWDGVSGLVFSDPVLGNANQVRRTSEMFGHMETGGSVVNK